MTPGARIAAAIEVLDEIVARHRPAASALKDWGMSHRFAGSGDRAAIGNIVHDALRQRRSIAWAIGADTPRALAIGTATFAWGESADQLAEQLAVPHAPATLTPDETARISCPDFSDVADAIRANVPDWVVQSLSRGLGDRWVGEMQAMAERPPFDIRVNRLKADRPKVVRALSKYQITETAVSPDGLRVPPTANRGRHPALQAEPAFRKGWFEVQDEGSQLAALCVGAKTGEQVLDLCAGAGGKTLALAAAMENAGQIHATDSDKHRLAPIFDRLRRAGTRNVQVHSAGSELPFTGSMDRVLIDAPCSGSGTWRRRPDAKWRLTEAAVARRRAEQAALLQQGAGFVRPGGLLVYVTCSLLPEENEDQVIAFGETVPDFEMLSANEIVAEASLAPETATILLAAAASPFGLMFTPRTTGTDGFYVAALRRRA